jgi:hypothetical protein
VGFFEPPPPPPPEPEHEFLGPEWLRPSGGILGKAVPLDLVLARTEKAVVAIRSVVAYPSGVEFTLSVRLRERRRRWAGDPLGMHLGPHERPVPDEILRFGVQFADGSKATTFGRHWPDPTEEDVTGPRLTPHGGGGGDRSWDSSYWLWPLPPPGLLAFVVEWPSEGIAETRIEVEAAPIRAAAERAEILWADTPGGGGSAYAETSFVVGSDDDEPAGPGTRYP